jgi:hypothetical protein
MLSATTNLARREWHSIKPEDSSLEPEAVSSSLPRDLTPFFLSGKVNANIDVPYRTTVAEVWEREGQKWHWARHIYQKNRNG